MKKTVSIMYRFIFILFSIWGICGTTGMSIFNLTPYIFDFTLFVNILNFLIILPIFLISISGYHGKILGFFKSIATMLSFTVLADNIYLMGFGVSYAWILGVFLPLMMIGDWLLFDKKGALSLSDIISWILGALVFFVLHRILLDSMLGKDILKSLLDIFGDFNEIWNFLIGLLGIGFLMFLGDSILSGFKNKVARGLWVLLYRVVFLLLEVYALLTVAGNELTSLIMEFKYFHVLANFLGAAMIALVLIYNLLKFKNFKRYETPFPRLKNGIAVSMLTVMFSHLMFSNGSYSTGFYNMVLFYIGPIMLLVDWILFERKGKLRVTDPLLWLILPFLYFAYVVSFPIQRGEYIYRVLTFSQPGMLLGFMAGITVLGYIIFFADRLMRRR